MVIIIHWVNMVVANYAKDYILLPSMMLIVIHLPSETWLAWSRGAMIVCGMPSMMMDNLVYTMDADELFLYYVPFNDLSSCRTHFWSIFSCSFYSVSASGISASCMMHIATQIVPTQDLHIKELTGNVQTTIQEWVQQKKSSIFSFTQQLQV